MSSKSINGWKQNGPRQSMRLWKINSWEEKKEYLLWLEEGNLGGMRTNEWGALNDKKEKVQVWRVLGVLMFSETKFWEKREF